MGTFGDSCCCRCPTLPAHGLETAGGQVAPQAASQPLLISGPPAGLRAPLPRRSAVTVCKAPSAPPVADGKGTREYKGGPGFQLGASHPARNQHRALCWKTRGWDSIKGACSPKGSPRRPGCVPAKSKSHSRTRACARRAPPEPPRTETGDVRQSNGGPWGRSGWRETESRSCSRGEPRPRRARRASQAGPEAGALGVGSPVSASCRAPLNTFSRCSLTQPRVLRRLERKPTAAAISGSMSVLFPVQRPWLMTRRRRRR